MHFQMKKYYMHARERTMNTSCKQTFFQSAYILPIVVLTFFATAWVFFVPPAMAYEQAPALMDLRTTFSDGDYDPETLVQMAVKKGFRVIFLNDHDRVVMEYGLPPFRNIIKKKEELNSINKSGAGAYLRTIADLRKKYPDVILIPGTESTPFYYWTGSPFVGTLTANDHERRILTMGLEKTGDYETLPILHNGLSGTHLRTAMPALLAFIISFLISIYF